MNTTARTNHKQSEVINIREILKAYTKYWYYFLISVILSLSVAFISIKRTPTQYNVQASILLRKDASKGEDISKQAILQAVGLAPVLKDVEDEIQILRSKNMIREVVRSLELQTSYYRKDKWQYTELYKDSPIKLILPSTDFNDKFPASIEFYVSQNDKGYKVKVKIGKENRKFFLEDLQTAIEMPEGIFRIEASKSLDKGVSYKIVSYPTEIAVELYKGSISVSLNDKKSNAITIKQQSACTPKAIDILNKLIDTYNSIAVKDQASTSSKGKAFIEDRLSFIEKELSDIEQRVENYKRQNKMTNISRQGDIIFSLLTQYQTERTRLKTDLQIINHLEIFINDKEKRFTSISLKNSPEEPLLPSIGPNHRLQLSIDKYNETLLERIRLLRITNEQNPVVLQLEDDLALMRENILSSIRSAKEEINISLRENELKTKELESNIKGMPTQEREFIEISRQQKIKEELFVFLLQKQEETALALASSIPPAKVFDSANASLMPVSPKKGMIFMIALIVGLLLPAGAISILNIINNKIRSSKELTRALPLPFLGSIPVIKDPQGAFLIKEGVNSPETEAFKTIRANLHFLMGNKQAPVILITSCISGEGKSFVATNLAVSLALTKKKVVLIEFDLRAPGICERLGIVRNNGLSLFLSDSSKNVSEMLKPSRLSPFLSVIPADPIPPNPAELLLSDRVEELIGELKKEFNYIIIDTPPCAVVSDAQLLNRIADNSLVVFRENYTPQEFISFINETNEANRLNNISLVLNASKTDELSFAYGSYFNKKKKVWSLPRLS